MRLKQLDILRAVAVLLVLLRHFSFAEVLRRGGWSGVDLFFVLSGFLISGLLFAEFRKTGKISVGRFLVRRGFKIYPAFYVFLGWTVVMFPLLGGQLRPGPMISELFFLQSYVAGMWPHTWTLAVEEHFYLALPLLLILLCRGARNRRDPFRALPWVFAVVACAGLALRLYLCRQGPVPGRVSQCPTHLNVDALLFGVTLSYFYHFRRAAFDRLANLPGWALLAGSVCLVSPCFILNLEESAFLQTVGHSMLFLGYGGLLVYALGERPSAAHVPLLRALGDRMAFLGKHSYSVYLWHHAVLLWGLEFLRRADLLPAGNLVRFAIYATCSFAIGIGMGRLVEIPALRVRDRLFPARSTALEVRDRNEDVRCPAPAMAPEAG
jgi:peptidoglycan/LPS O-acetylase OafA/YrhL